jgi:hypothetical protein
MTDRFSALTAEAAKAEPDKVGSAKVPSIATTSRRVWIFMIEFTYRIGANVDNHYNFF